MELNKNKLQEALQTVALYTCTETQILQKFLNIETEGIVVIKSTDLQKQLGVSHTAIYSSLKNLEFKGVLIKLRDQRNSYKLNVEKLESIIKIYDNIRN